MTSVDVVSGALDLRLVDRDGVDLTGLCVLTGSIPDVVLTATPEVARRITRVEMRSPHSDLWCRNTVGAVEREHLARGRPLRIDARVRLAG